MATISTITLRDVLETAAPPYTDAAMRILFCTSIVAGNNRYRIRDLEFYHADDPYTHQADEQISTTGGWYFHRTKPGGGWKGGTFMGLDITFAPVGTAGGILIRGLSRCDDVTSQECYTDGSCNCTRELLKACGAPKIQDLVAMPSVCLHDALATDSNSTLRLVEHEPRPLTGNKTMEWKACSRVGLTAPDKKPKQLKERQKYHLKPYRFLSIPFETKKERTKIKASTEGGVFTVESYNQAIDSAKVATKVGRYSEHCSNQRKKARLRK